MAQPLGLSQGDSYVEEGVEFQVVSVTSDGVYSVRIVGKSRNIIRFQDLVTETRPIVNVADTDNPDFVGMWAEVNGNYEKQEYVYIPA